MYGQKKKPTAKPNSVDTLIKKLAELSPSVDLLVASALGGYSLYASFVDSAKLVGLICLLFSSVFAVMGIASIMRQMKDCRMIEENANPEALRAMKTAQFEKFLIALFKLDGYRVRLAIDELHRLDDADLILERKKETILLQYNHWDEEAVGIKPLQSLYKAASNFRAHGCLVVTCGGFTPEARDWAQRKGVVLMNMDDILAMARRLTGSSQSPTIPLQEDSLQVEGQQGELEISRQDDISPSRTICGRAHREERGWRSTLNRASFLRAVRSSSRLTAVSASMLQALGVCARQCSSRNPEANFSPFRQGASHADQISPPAGAVVHKVRRGCQHHHRLPGQELGIRPVNGPEVLCIHGEVDVSDLGGPPACPFENEGLWRSVRFVMRVVVIIRWRSLVKTCTGSDCLDTVLQLRRPFAWHKPDGLHGVV